MTDNEGRPVAGFRRRSGLTLGMESRHAARISSSLDIAATRGTSGRTARAPNTLERRLGRGPAKSSPGIQEVSIQVPSPYLSQQASVLPVTLVRTTASGRWTRPWAAHG